MQDFKAKLEKLLAEAEDCDLIGNLAGDAAKRATFRRLAAQLREMAGQLHTELLSRSSEAEVPKVPRSC